MHGTRKGTTVFAVGGKRPGQAGAILILAAPRVAR